MIAKMLEYYDDRNFEFDKNDQLAGVNTVSVSQILIKQYGVKTNNQEQMVADDIHVYPDGILCNPSSKSKTIHVFTGTWMEGEKPLKRKIVTGLKTRIKTKKQAGLYAKLFR